MPLILEGIVTSRNADRSVNVAPMGPIVDRELSSLLLRPFQSSLTCQNLLRTRCGVFLIVDDVELIARAALNRLVEAPATVPAHVIDGEILSAACRWHEFEVTDINLDDKRAELRTRIVHDGRQRDFFGFNRACHAVLEATILATRLHLMAASAVVEEMERLRPLVEKTGGDTEHRAFSFVEQYVAEMAASGKPVA
ncbi:hypothetical protein Mal4_32640 [Maioricimonas rarisocia]|uniref:DUF447 family protein n=1 Tax=Maioricimonas rarisocia TaxID=2528026 RepID=A0A517Z8X3_9PLAN|nr:DUF447 domain-containing protein [Maioricimonas rarisocia]QDU38932.1 hypothetical protein Mal4_32640 [Maioricimonas rarisocia]